MMRRTGKSKPCVGRWRARFMTDGVDGLLRDKTRPSRVPSVLTRRRTRSLSVDERSQIQALDRTQPGLPMKEGRAGTMTCDYKRHGTKTLVAALNVLEGTVLGRNMARHRHQEFLRHRARGAAGQAGPSILDNYASHKLTAPGLPEAPI